MVQPENLAERHTYSALSAAQTAEQQLPRMTGLYMLVVGFCLILLLIVQPWLLTIRRPIAAIELSGRAAPVLLQGFHDVEQDGARYFRWTNGASEIAFDRPSMLPLLLTLRLGAPPADIPAPTLTLHIDQQPYIAIPVDTRPRSYHVLLPKPSLSAQLTLGLFSSTITVPPDTRTVGLRFEGALLEVPASAVAWPPLALLLCQLLLLVLTMSLTWRLASPPPLTVALLLLMATALVGFSVTQPLFAFTYFWRLTIVLALCTAATFWLLPLAYRLTAPKASASFNRTQFVHALFGIMLLACGIRLIGALYPLFSAHDLPLNVERFIRTLSGTLVSTNRSFEFRSGVTIYPPGPYLAMLPAFLLGIAPGVVVQAGNAIVDGLGAPMAVLLACVFGTSRRAALFAGLLYAALPVSLTSLYWGHSAQVFGQAMMAPLAIVLLAAFQAERRASQSPIGVWKLWGAAGALLTIALLSHIGVSILAIAWLGLAWVAVIMRHTISRAGWWHFTLALGIAGLVGFILVYGPALSLKLDQTARVGERVLEENSALPILIARAFQISFYELGLWLLLPGLLLIPRMLPHGVVELAGTWICAVLLFLGVELLTGLQVRYLVFLAPIASILIGVFLDRFATHGRVAHHIALLAIVLMIVQGCVAWYAGVFADIQMSMVPLLR